MAHLKLYVKRTCPWCVQAQEWLDTRGVPYELADVLADPAAYQSMINISGQRYTPTLVIDDTHMLADFGPEQLPEFLKMHGLAP